MSLKGRSGEARNANNSIISDSTYSANQTGRNTPKLNANQIFRLKKGKHLMRPSSRKHGLMGKLMHSVPLQGRSLSSNGKKESEIGSAQLISFPLTGYQR